MFPAQGRPRIQWADRAIVDEGAADVGRGFGSNSSAVRIASWETPTPVGPVENRGSLDHLAWHSEIRSKDMFIVLASTSFAAPRSTAPAPVSVSPARVAAEASARDWLAFVDGGHYSVAWDEASFLLTTGLSRAAWETQLAEVRSPLGAVRSRTLRSAVDSPQLPFTFGGICIVITYDTVFEHKAAAVETVITALQADGSWPVSGYFVR